MDGTQLQKARPHFQDERLSELFFRYKARNFPQSLTAEEQQQWEEHRIARLIHGEAQARTVESYFNQIDSLSETADEETQDILGALYDYAELVVPVQ